MLSNSNLEARVESIPSRRRLCAQVSRDGGATVSVGSSRFSAFVEVVEWEIKARFSSST